MARDLKPVYTAPSEFAARERFAEFTQKWGQQYPAIIKMWDNAWSEFVPFLDYDVEIRRVICSTISASYSPYDLLRNSARPKAPCSSIE